MAHFCAECRSLTTRASRKASCTISCSNLTSYLIALSRARPPVAPITPSLNTSFIFCVKMNKQVLRKYI